MALILGPRELRQEEEELEAGLSYKARSCLKKPRAEGRAW
jgi:hypothetical protein